MADENGDRPELIVVLLNEPSYLDDVLAAMLEVGIVSATVVESQGMGRLLSRDMPIFASFRHLLTGGKPYTYAIMAPVLGRSFTLELRELLRDVLRRVPGEDRGYLLAVPLGCYFDLSDQP